MGLDIHVMADELLRVLGEVAESGEDLQKTLDVLDPEGERDEELDLCLFHHGGGGGLV